jgi:thiol-disulfide isomerase/thioredoxin
MLIAAVLCAATAFGQKKAIFLDSLGQRTTYELHWAQVVGGRYCSVYDRKTRLRTLVRTTPAEFAKALAATDTRIRRRDRLGTPFPTFALTDLAGQPVSSFDLAGRVTVINFWFVGCTPCEMERPELNALRQQYATDERVRFLSFAASSPEQLRRFLADHPILYDVVPLPKPEVERQFGVSNFPVNVVLDRTGRYVFNSLGSGVGIGQLLRREIDGALARP